MPIVTGISAFDCPNLVGGNFVTRVVPHEDSRVSPLPLRSISIADELAGHQAAILAFQARHSPKS